MKSIDARIPYSACPLCDSTDNAEFLIADCSKHPMYKAPLPTALRWISCKKCGHVFVDGYFGPAALEILFHTALPYQSPGYEVEDQRYVWSLAIDAVNRHRSIQGGHWLDVGFGNGSLLTTAAEFGYDVVGLDLRKENVRLMRELGYDAHAVEFDEYSPSEPFDVISMADVLEHMPFPRRALDRAWDLLRPDGLLFLSMPNADSFLWQQMTRNGINPYWGEIEHLHNFGRKRLYALLNERGFSPVHYGISVRYQACMEVIARKSERSSGR